MPYQCTLVAASAAALLLSACGGEDPSYSSRLATAAIDCELAPYVKDSGKTVILDTQGEEDDRLDGPYPEMEQLACLLDAMETPDYIRDHMANTTGNDGLQTDTWDGIEARFKYHPDNGFDLVLVDMELQ